MSTLVIEEKQVVIPGDVLAEGMDFLPGKGAYREGDHILSSRLGLLNVSGRILNVIPLSGRYVPRRDDVVIGYVKDMSYSSWFVDVGYAYEASLSMKDATADFIERGSSLSDYFAVGEIILTRVSNVTKEGNIDLSMKGPGLRKLSGGKILEITSSKIPRVVGKQGSMISLIKDKTGCSIFAGQNGRIWIRGPSPEAEKLASDAILLINEKAHTSGLTEKVGAFLEQHALEIQK
jgi:exosome complex component RRP4